MQKEMEFETRSTISLTDNCQLILKTETGIPKEQVSHALLLIKVEEDDYRICHMSMFKFVEEDEIIPFDEFRDTASSVLKEVEKNLVADSKGAWLILRNRIPFIIGKGRRYASDEVIEAVKKLLDEYKLETFLIECYQVLVKYKGSDTFERRRLERMIKQQEGGKVNAGFFY